MTVAQEKLRKHTRVSSGGYRSDRGAGPGKDTFQGRGYTARIRIFTISKMHLGLQSTHQAGDPDRVVFFTLVWR